MVVRVWPCDTEAPTRMVHRPDKAFNLIASRRQATQAWAWVLLEHHLVAHLPISVTWGIRTEPIASHRTSSNCLEVSSNLIGDV